MDSKGWSRKKSVLVCAGTVIVLSIPCVLGFNILSGFQPLGAGSTIMDLEDFIVSNNLLPLEVSVIFFSVQERMAGAGIISLKKPMQVRD